ncbi:MAG: tRNA pseudouridine(38-40) synthase TruA [Lachnospiraceae bacterium]|nr:tRNA pseudouridine(38-40) synthase TruA [Lachnospiraceae bacterium]
MRNFKVILQYEGTKYQGWQRQDTTNNTLQGKLEALLTKMCGHNVEVHASGRTDAGVHALGQTANFHLNTQMTPEEIMNYMNRYLPEDVAVISIEEVGERFHSRLNAKGKTYVYRVLNTDVPHIFDRRYVYVFPEKLDIMAMQKAATYLTGTHDFKAFTSNRRMKKSSVRTITSIRIEAIQDEIRFTYEGNGFLYHMVRILTGTLLEVGTGERKPEEMLTILESGQRENAGPLVPAKGLTLVEVRYS